MHTRCNIALVPSISVERQGTSYYSIVPYTVILFESVRFFTFRCYNAIFFHIVFSISFSVHSMDHGYSCKSFSFVFVRLVYVRRVSFVVSLGTLAVWLIAQGLCLRRGSGMMPGQMGLIALMVLSPLVQEGSGTWSLYEKFFFAPQGLPESESGGDCPAGDPSKCRKGERTGEGGVGDRGSKSSPDSDPRRDWFGNRGSNSSPDPHTDEEWFWWVVKIWWISIGKLADTGLVWCGTLCASVGVAAQWSYWLLVAVVGVFLFQLLIWTVTWVVCPFWRHARALARYLCGKGGWHEVAHLHGISVYRPRWVGPKGQEAWTAEYVQQSVRGRGDNREPHDLLITDGVAIARLRHGTLRGRTNRNGYRLQCTAVHSASHRYLRNQLDAYNLEIHLCSTDPCGLDEDDCLHVMASAIIPIGQRRWIYKKRPVVGHLAVVRWPRGSGVADAHLLRLCGGA